MFDEFGAVQTVGAMGSVTRFSKFVSGKCIIALRVPVEQMRYCRNSTYGVNPGAMCFLASAFDKPEDYATSLFRCVGIGWTSGTSQIDGQEQSA
jgi:hypothetical protein